jgi:hypothetical protein
VNRAVLIAATSILAASLVSGCGAAGAEKAGDVPSGAAPASSTAAAGSSTGTATTATAPASATAEASGGGAAKTRFQVWFVGQGGRLVPVREQAKATPRVATAALRALLAGPQTTELATAIPVDTELLGVRVANGVATANFTSEYETGANELSMQLRLGQVVYTLTQFPTVKGVRFELDGKPVSVFSSEGIVLDHPVGRADYANLVPAIVVESPTPGQTSGTPIHVSGTANVFEAAVAVDVLDANGRKVGSAATTASCGTGCRGRFSVFVDYSVTTEQHGTVVVHDDDADGDGHPQHEVRIHVDLLPAT